jgi:phage terminase large subunit-like protein
MAMDLEGFLLDFPPDVRSMLRNTGAQDEIEDKSPWEWYSETCPCGIAKPFDNPAVTCEKHPRARANQRPPEGEWSTWLAKCGRGWGKTRASVEWCRWKIENGDCKRFAIVGATASDCRDVLIEGQSGLLSVCPPWFYPKYEPSKRRLTFPNGAIATTYSAEEPNRLRGPQHDGALCDEVAAWLYPETYDMLKLGLRLGKKPQIMIATTPRPTKLIRQLVADPRTVVVGGSTFENRSNLAEDFFETVVSTYENTRLGQQEIYAELLDTVEGARFSRFSVQKHVSTDAEYSYSWPVHLAIDCGVSRHVGACFFQVVPVGYSKNRIVVFGEYLGVDKYSAENARAILEVSESLPSRGAIDVIRVDPAAVARSGVGPAAYGEFESVFGSRRLAKCPRHSVMDALDFMECLLDQGNLIVHPRCENLIKAFQNYQMLLRSGEYLSQPAPDQSPHEDMLDSLRYGIRDRFPEGNLQQPNLRTIRGY